MDTLTRLRFSEGDLTVAHAPTWLAALPEATGNRASLTFPASAYASVVLGLRARGDAYVDEARAFVPLTLTQTRSHQPRGYQKEALAAWHAAGRRGVVVLPTGAGKSFVAELAIALAKRPSLVVVPTLELVAQWLRGLASAFPELALGQLGGGVRRLGDLTVATYDSAALTMREVGNRFGLIIFDECHHLPAPVFREAAECALAPYRLGLSATPGDDPDRQAQLGELIGNLVYEQSITELRGAFLADYDVIQVPVELDPGERRRYEAARGHYLSYLRGAGFKTDSADGWQRFVREAARTREGRAALDSFRLQRSIAFEAAAKFDVLLRLLERHDRERKLVFTQDNAAAYRVGRHCLLPVITHHTSAAERRTVLEAFKAGALRAVVTSKVLNEGVDVPEASVAIILSGSGSVREHVQRLGRVLRKHGAKRARLYEIIAAETTEVGTSERRRAHRAYR